MSKLKYFNSMPGFTASQTLGRSEFKSIDWFDGDTYKASIVPALSPCRNCGWYCWQCSRCENGSLQSSACDFWCKACYVYCARC